MSSPTGEREEVFPWMEHAVVAGGVIGAVAAVLLGLSLELGAGELVLAGLFGSLAGDLVGVCVALYWARTFPADRTTVRDLWDPWLDAQNPLGETEVEVALPVQEPVETPSEIIHWRARVRPRIISPESGEALPLEDTIGPILAGGESGAVRIVGGAGAGKTTALIHLAGLLPPHLRVSFLDDPTIEAESDASSPGWVVSASDTRAPSATNLQLAPWGKDEWIEYLLATDRRLCSSVMSRLALAKRETVMLGGVPELWGLVLDRMMVDPSVPGPGCAIRDEVRDLLPDDQRHIIEGDCFAAVSNSVQCTESLRRHHPSAKLRRLIRHRPVQLLLAADWITDAIRGRSELKALAVTPPRDLVLEAASRIANDSDLVDRLRSLMSEGDKLLHPMVASLLHSLRVGWKPGSPPPRLAGAYLDQASWPEIDLTDAEMPAADLGGANLVGANLDRASLGSADLTFARLTGASLVGADLRSTKLDDADFSRADLSGAIMQALNLAGARFTCARFTGADLSGCNLEGVSLPRAMFEDADLQGALLTGSSMPGADFSGARLRAAGLAEIEWEGADLQGADLREAAFHLGSSRSGLVGSPLACEGSRTGFYTDDWSEQDFKSPEEIRKANLCGADLRGAKIDDVDFYLVDLRGARLDAKQIPHIRRCGAILEARA